MAEEEEEGVKGENSNISEGEIVGLFVILAK